MLYHDQIEIDSRICSGKPVIRGTRILVTSILSQLAAGESFDSIRAGFPGLTDEAIRAALEFAKDSIESTELAALRGLMHRLFIDPKSAWRSLSPSEPMGTQSSMPVKPVLQSETTRPSCRVPPKEGWLL